MSDKRSGESPLAALSRAFFGQFFSSESVTSDIQLRQTSVWVLAFLLTPESPSQFWDSAGSGGSPSRRRRPASH